MIHYSCDRCKRKIDTAHEVRHVVKIEIQPAMEPPPTEETEDDRDHLMEIHEMLESVDPEDELTGIEEDHRRLCFDLCPDCYHKFIDDPLGAEALWHVEFSHN